MAEKVLLFTLTNKVKNFLTNTLVSVFNVTSLARTLITSSCVMTYRIMLTRIG